MNKIQEFVQRRCVMAAHPECETYEEALDRDWVKNYESLKRLVRPEYNGGIAPDYYKGLPCTLNRILNAFYQDSLAMSVDGHDFIPRILSILEIFKYLKQNGDSALFDDQTPGIQIKIAQLLGYKGGLN
jgi:hypothetical protein